MDNEATFVKVLGTYSLTDIAIIKSVLDAEDVKYYFLGENLISIGPAGPALLMVADEDLNRAIELLKPLKLNYSHILFGNDERN